MGLVLAGINHKTASLKIRERISFTRKKLKELLVELKQADGMLGAAILSTCNRTEVYAHMAKDKEQIKRFFLRSGWFTDEEFSRYFYILEDADVIRHIFRVASGLDSQVLGETQILGQIKDAWITGKDLGVISEMLDRLFEKAVDTGKIVRQETKVSRGNISIGSLAIKMIEKRFTPTPTLSAGKNQGWCGGLRDKSILIIGAGKIGILVSKYLKEKDARGIFVSNRTYEKAAQLALDCGGEAINFSRLKEKLEIVDAVISSTASPHFILKKEILTEVMRARRGPLLIIDLALPRDVDPEAKNISDISLYDLDDLKSVAEENYAKRKKEVKCAEVIIQRELNIFKVEISNGIDTERKILCGKERLLELAAE